MPRSSVSAWSARAAAVCVAGALFLAPCASAQESEVGTGQPPRPKVVYDGQFNVDRIGYDIPFFIQEGSNRSKADAHIYYAPAFLLSMDMPSLSAGISDTGTLHCGTIEECVAHYWRTPSGIKAPPSIQSQSVKHHFDEDNESLTLYFKWAADHEKIEAALRLHLQNDVQNDAPKNSEGDPKKDAEPYRVAALPADHVIFHSVKDYLQDDGTRKPLSSEKVLGVTQQRGEFTVDFYDISKSQADKFIADLQKNRTQIEYSYSFAGISDEKCFAEFKNILDQDIDLFKELEGEGGEGLVARHQVASIAERAVSSELYTARCSSALNAQQLLNGLLERAGQVEKYDVEDSWDQLDKLVNLDAESFKADLIKSLDEEADATIMEIAEELSTKSSTNARSWGTGAEVSALIKDIPVKAAAKFGKAQSSAKSKAMGKFTESLRKWGINVEFDGEKFIPKSVDVHREEDLRKRLGQTVKIEVSTTAGVEGFRMMRLTESDRTVVVPRQDFEEVRNELNTLKRAFDSKVSSLQAKDTTLDSRLNRLRSILRKNVEDMEDDIDELGSELQILTKSYKFAKSVNYRTQQYITDINTAEYPVAAIIAWEQGDCDPDDRFDNWSNERKSPQLEGIKSISKWLIRIDWWFFNACDFAWIDIMYFPRKIANASSFYAYTDNVNETIPLMDGGDRDDE